MAKRKRKSGTRKSVSNPMWMRHAGSDLGKKAGRRRARRGGGKLGAKEAAMRAHYLSKGKRIKEGKETFVCAVTRKNVDGVIKTWDFCRNMKNVGLGSKRTRKKAA